MKLNITPNDFEYLKVIGKGYFGKVMKVKYKSDQQIYALKTIKKSKLKQQKHIEHIRCERKILESIDHPFIISLKFAFQTSTKLYIVMEFCNGGELFYHIRKKGRFSIKEAQFYFSQIVLAIEYLHKKKIIYRYRKNKIEI
jgi:serine/threonine protein kinase